MKVLKFGGSSLADAQCIQSVANILLAKKDEWPLIVVFSAFGGMTDDLGSCGDLAASSQTEYRDKTRAIEARCLKITRNLLPVQAQSGALAQIKILINELEDVLKGISLLKELSPKTKDLLLSFGERISGYVISQALKHSGIPVQHQDARELILTDRNFGDATPDIPETKSRIKAKLSDISGIVVIPGFIAATVSGETSTLGRGGSDFSAAMIAATLNAESLEIWTDVNGMLTTNPRYVPNAQTIGQLTFEEAMELSHFGAKVIYPPTIQPVQDKNIPVLIRNTFDPEGSYTEIRGSFEETQVPVKGMTSMDGIALLSLSGTGLVGVPGSSMRLFGALAGANISVILITQASSEHSISFAIPENDVEAAVQAVEEAFAWEISTGKVNRLAKESGLSIIALVGNSMRNRVGLSGAMFSTLGLNGVNIRAIAQGSSERIISTVIKASDVAKALNVLHEAFFETDTHKAHLFVVGMGTVGKVLLEQIAAQKASLKSDHGIELKLMGIANSRKMLISAEEVDMNNWRDSLDSHGEDSDMGDFLEKMKVMNLHNSIFIDNTANADIASMYEAVLSANISIVTPNKIAAASDHETYLRLKKTARRYGAKYLFETNVGAGLPVIGTLSDLVRSGDRIQRIDAVLSGTLNFIFNEFKAGTKFHEIVRRAQEEGYSEPDPRIDLSGVDVMRKILILARESGYEMELNEISADPFMPDSCLKTETVADFYKQLEIHAEEFERMRVAAETRGERLKYTATFENGKAKVGLRSYDPSHPFYELQGTDNIVLFKTDRYAEQPLVIKGAGAGAEVTAMGIFADIIRIVNN